MKIAKSKKRTVNQFAKVALSKEDDEVLDAMKSTLSTIHSHYTKKLTEDHVPLVLKTCDIYERIVQEQRKRAMIMTFK